MITSLIHRKFLIIGLFSLLLLLLLFACGGGSDDNDSYVPPIEPTVITPSNLSLSINIKGVDVNNPNGDGTGIIQCIASATKATSYGFRFGDGTEINSATGNLEYTFTEKGTKNYTVTVLAYSSTGHSVSTSKTITVYVNNQMQLVWSDEFDSPGSPDSSKWGYDIGAGGWGNNESQYYTSRTDNVVVEGGFLKITAQKEIYQGSGYTSARMLTKGKYDFTYGKVEVRAKLPTGGGTWPAIWMLGSNFTTVGWPACGEIDIMEHVGNNQGTIQSALHNPSSYGATVNKGSKYISDVSTAFHVYAVEWSSQKMDFSVDGTIFYTYNPTTKNSNTWPYDANQFIILNVAMGGNFGGAIDANFTSSTFEIDYVRVYQ